MARLEDSPKIISDLETSNSGSDDSAKSSPNQVVAEPSEFSARTELSIFSKIAIWALIYNLAAIAWGVYVRASNSGDGCGSHWPLCDGSSTPLHGPMAKIVEATHRLSTGLVGVIAIGLVVMAVRRFPPRSQPRFASYSVLGLAILEGLIGFLLVKFQLVTTNSSGYRAGIMSFHVVSTFLLMGSLTLAAYTGSGERRLQLKGQGAVGWALGLAFIFLAGLGVSGSISALGHTLDPVTDVLKAASNPTTFWMVRVQPYHPYISLAVGMYVVLLATLLCNLRPSAGVRRSSIWMVGAFLTELAIGLVNIKTMAPVSLQMLHLVAADASVVTLVWFAASALTEGVPWVEKQPDNGYSPVPSKLSPRQLLNEYIWLTKPRIISLLLFTTMTALFASAGGWPGLGLLLAVFVGGYLMAGAANAINMVVERDLDRAMERTRGRPTVTQNISTSRALGFALTIACLAFTILTAGANLLTATLALAGLVCYVSVYTLGLKRRTWNNIVIGGAAGAFPPLVGWAAGQNGLAPLAYYLFGIIFLWTPVHFWALAILIKDDYAAAGVPMLPVVKGVRATTVQICVYTALTVAVTSAPILGHLVGWGYAVTAAFLNVYLVIYCAKLFRHPEKTEARGLFKYSMVYLALLFVAVAVDRSASGNHTLVTPVSGTPAFLAPAGAPALAPGRGAGVSSNSPIESELASSPVMDGNQSGSLETSVLSGLRVSGGVEQRAPVALSANPALSLGIGNN